MEGMTTHDQLLGQDDIDALFANANKAESSGPSESDNSGTKEGEDAAEGLLGQDDIDALLSPVESKKEDKPVTVFRDPEKIPDEFIRSLSVQIYNRSVLSREPGVQVIWNALNTLPMNPGMSLNIQGLEYKTLGVLHAHHLVVKNGG